MHRGVSEKRNVNRKSLKKQLPRIDVECLFFFACLNHVYSVLSQPYLLVIIIFKRKQKAKIKRGILKAETVLVDINYIWG